MTKEEFILNAAAQMAGPMLAARDEDGVSIYSAHDVRDEAVHLGELMCGAHTIEGWRYYEIREAVKEAIVTAKTLDSDNDYGTRRGKLCNLLNELEVAANRLDRMVADTYCVSLFSEAEEDYKKLMECYDEGIYNEP